MNNAKHPTVPITDKILIAQTDTRNTVGVPVESKPQANNELLLGGGLVIGGAAVWAAIAKLLERFGTSALDAREQRIKQELEQDKGIAQFYLNEANRDSETINTTLNLFVTKHLDTTTQMFDLYYELLEKYRKLSENQAKIEERLEIMEVVLKDILAVLQMKDRQNK